MPALDVIATFTDHDRSLYERDRPAAEQFATRLPLVRVVVPRAPGRRIQEIEDVFAGGVLRTEHRGAGTRDIEAQLGIGPFLYFHAGRSHSDYGDAIFVFDDLEGSYEATPFGLGGLCCPGPPDPFHLRCQCVDPVAHESQVRQSQFVSDSTWKPQWRSEAAKYLAAYFGGRLEEYFDSSPSAKPTLTDPDLIFGDSRNTDWRAWTIEVRSSSDVNLFDVVRSGCILWWGVPDWLEDTMFVTALSNRRRPAERYPLLAQLPSHLRVSVTDAAGTTDFGDLQQSIQEFTLT